MLMYKYVYLPYCYTYLFPVDIMIIIVGLNALFLISVEQNIINGLFRIGVFISSNPIYFDRTNNPIIYWMLDFFFQPIQFDSVLKKQTK